MSTADKEPAASVVSDAAPSSHLSVGSRTMRGQSAALASKPFKQLWLSLGLSSFGDWLGLLATTALAVQLGSPGGYAQANFAVAGVLALRLLPAALLGPFAGVLADRWDRRLTMVVGDVLRAACFVAIALHPTLLSLFVFTFISEIIALLWIPAKEATVPNLVPAKDLQSANQLGLSVTYGSAPFAAAFFALIAALADHVWEFSAISLALWINALTFLVAAVVIMGLPIPPRPAKADGPAQTGVRNGFGLLPALREGAAFAWEHRVVRGLLLGLLGAFATAGCVVGVAPTFARDLGAGDAGYAILFAAVFTGLGLGVWFGPGLLDRLPKGRKFAVSIVATGVLLFGVALITNLVVGVVLCVGTGFFAGVAWVVGVTMLGVEVPDEVRGRVMAFAQTGARVALVTLMVLAPLVAGWLGTHDLEINDDLLLTYNGNAIVLFIAAIAAISVGLITYRQLGGHELVPLAADLRGALQERYSKGRSPQPATHEHPGILVAFEGGDGCGKSTQARLLEAWLIDQGYQPVMTRQPGGSKPGVAIRDLVLGNHKLDPRTEALLFAADRAQHVADVVKPALSAGDVVVTDRFTDSSIAYQSAGRHMSVGDIAWISSWACQGVRPDAVIVLDLDPEVAAQRRKGRPDDRMEAAGLDFHHKVRECFLEIAERNPREYLVVDASEPAQDQHEKIREWLGSRLPPTPAERAAEAERLRREAEEAAERELAARLKAEAEAERKRQELEAKRAAEEEARRLREEQRAERARQAAQERAEREEAERQRREEQRQARIAAEEQRRLEALARQAKEAERRRIELEEQIAEAARIEEETKRLIKEAEAAPHLGAQGAAVPSPAEAAGPFAPTRPADKTPAEGSAAATTVQTVATESSSAEKTEKSPRPGDPHAQATTAVKAPATKVLPPVPAPTAKVDKVVTSVDLRDPVVDTTIADTTPMKPSPAPTLTKRIPAQPAAMSSQTDGAADESDQALADELFGDGDIGGGRPL